MALKPLRILYIEDERDIREVATLALETVGGFVVEACGSGEEGLRSLPGFKPDVILLDVMMPGTDGPTTLARLRKLPEAQGVPAVFMTAKAQPHEIAELKAIGALDVIAKPFDPMTLPRTVSDILGRQVVVESGAALSAGATVDSLAQLAEAFAAALPARLEEIVRTVDRLCAEGAGAEAREALHRSVHSLTGSAATFGFPLVSVSARSLELFLKDLGAGVLDAQQAAQLRTRLHELTSSARQPRESIAFPGGAG